MQKTARLDIHNGLLALETYKANTGNWPDPHQGFAQVVKAGILKNVPKDPWKHNLTWSFREGEPVVSSFGADGVTGGTGFDVDLSSADPDE